MRIITILANVILLGIAIFLTADEMNHLKSETLFYAFFFIVTPVLSIITIYRSSSNGARKSWVALWLERKALEEKKKIEELSKHDDC